MGFWGTLWSGIKSVASAVFHPVVKAVQAVANVVTKVVTPVVDAVKKFVDVVTAPVRAAVSYIGEKFNQAKDWFLQQTSIGRGLNRAYNFVMDNTGLRTGLNWVKEKVGKAKEWFDSTAVGRCVNTLMPVIQLGGYMLGGIPGYIVRGMATAKNTYNAVMENPLSFIPGARNIADYIGNKFNNFIGPAKNFVSEKYNQFKSKAHNFYQATKDSVKNSSLGRWAFEKSQKIHHFAKDNYKKINDSINDSWLFTKGKRLMESGKQIYDKGKQIFAPYYHKIAQNQHVKKGLNALNNYKASALKYGRKYAPHLYQLGSRGYDYGQTAFNSLRNNASRIYHDSIGKTSYGRKFNKFMDISNRFAYKPIKGIGSFAWDKIGKPFKDYSWEKFQETNTYKKYFETPIKTFREIKNEAKHIGAKKIISQSAFGNQIKNQNRQNKIDSSNFLASYLNKYGGESKSVEKIKNKFISVSDYQPKLSNFSKDNFEQKTPLLNPEQKSTRTLNSLVQSNQVKIHSLVFDAGKRGSSYTIGGNMQLQNKTNNKVDFEILPGQIFGCSKAKTSQHTVVRSLKGSLESNEKKEFILESFCGDSGLKWPYGDSNYTLTNYLLKQFRSDIDQSTVWSYTS